MVEEVKVEPVKANGANEKKEKDEKVKVKKGAKKEEEMSDEDIQKKAEIDLLVLRAQDPDIGVQKLALETTCTEIKTATASMTSVPKPLKFLRPHYPTLKKFYEDLPLDQPNKARFSDVVSILAMTTQPEGSRECLKYRLSGSEDSVGSWGHEYVRHLAGEIGIEFSDREEKSLPTDDLEKLIDEIIPFQIKHNAEPEACDLLMEVELLPKLLDYVDDSNYQRIGLYLLSCASYAVEPEDATILKTCFDVYYKLKKLPDALRIALKVNDKQKVKDVFDACTDTVMKKQLAFILAREQRTIPGLEDESLSDILNNVLLNQQFLAVARDLDITEAKTPEDIYKTHLTESRQTLTANVDSARQNLASTFVNAFVNASFGQDKLMTQDGNKWLYKNKEHGMMSASASLGMIMLWDSDGGLGQIDKYMYSTEEWIKAGSLLGIGLVHNGIRNDCDPVLALLTTEVENSSPSIKIGAILGLGLAYAGSAREELLDLLTPVVADAKTGIEAASLAALALGLVFVGTSHNDVAETIVQALMEREESQLEDTMARFMALGLGLLFLGKGEAADATIEACKTLNAKVSLYAQLTVETLAYTGTGNVLKVQKMLSICSEHLEKDNAHQAVAVLGIAQLAMAEELGSDMAVRTLEHLLQYGEQNIRRAVPLAIGLLSVSSPKITVMDTLSKLSHDADAEVAQGAIFALGLVGAGTNNARIAGLLRQLAAYYHKDANHLFLVRIAQGLLHMGKGLISINPFHSNRLLMSTVAVSGLVAVLHASLDFKNIILSSRHYLLYLLVCAMYPRMLVTLDSDLKPLSVSVRVGQAVDTVGQAGRPKTITGFQTHTTPVLIGVGERAELATDEYIPESSVLEGFVILKPNPEFVKS